MPDETPPWPPPGMAHGYTAPRSPPVLEGEALARYNYLQTEIRRVQSLRRGYDNYLTELEKQLADLLKNGYAPRATT